MWSIIATPTMPAICAGRHGGRAAAAGSHTRLDSQGPGGGVGRYKHAASGAHLLCCDWAAATVLASRQLGLQAVGHAAQHHRSCRLLLCDETEPISYLSSFSADICCPKTICCCRGGSRRAQVAGHTACGGVQMQIACPRPADRKHRGQQLPILCSIYSGILIRQCNI